MNNTVVHKSLGSELLTGGIRVRVVPRYLPEQSKPADRRFVFAYTVTITNEGSRVVTLQSRRWLIVDANGASSEVEGEGVVGQQPVLAPGETFEYSSFCPLPTPWGTMEGSYTFEDDGADASFPVRIGRFYLVSSASGN